MSDMRIGGLASGMDTDKIIKDLMKVEKMPLDKMEKKQTSMEWERDAYREVNTKLLSFREDLVNMKLSTSYRSRTTSSTHEDLVTATANSSASESSFSLSSVSQLATAATKVNNGGLFNDPTAVDPKSSFAELEGSMVQNFSWSQGSVESETIKIEEDGEAIQLSLQGGAKVQNATSEMMVKVDGERFTVKTSGTAADLGDKEVLVDADGNLSFKDTPKKGTIIEVDFIADKAVESTKLSDPASTFQLKKGDVVEGSLEIMTGTSTYTTNAAGEILDDGGAKVGTVDYNKGTISFDDPIAADSEVGFSYQENYTTSTIGSHTADGYKEEIFAIQGSDSLNDFIRDVNNADVGVNAFYDDFTGQMSMTRTETGNFNQTGQEIMTSGEFMNQGLRFGSATETGGENAVFTMNGLSTERSSNNFTVNGVTLNLKSTFGETGTNNPTVGNVKLSVNNDTDAVFEKIKKFVEKYNETIDFMNEKVNEEFYRDYKPLTDKEREDLSETQAELWDEKAKSGLLRNDQTIESGLSGMRRDFYSPVSNPNVSTEYQQLSSIGITTTSNYMEGGKLEIDEAQLKKALEEDPESVEELFTASSDDYGRKGVINRVYDSVVSTMEKITDKAGNQFQSSSQYSIGRDLESISDEMNDFQDRLDMIEDRYWSQFGAMETAIQKMNQQSAYIMQNFG